MHSPKSIIIITKQVALRRKNLRILICADRGKAEDYIDTERCDPIYDKAFMGKCTFEIEEIGAEFGRSKASAKYNESNVKQVKMNLNRKTDADIIEHLSRCENVQGYIKNLIRKDMGV